MQYLEHSVFLWRHPVDTWDHCRLPLLQGTCGTLERLGRESPKLDPCATCAGAAQTPRPATTGQESSDAHGLPAIAILTASSRGLEKAASVTVCLCCFCSQKSGFQHKGTRKMGKWEHGPNTGKRDFPDIINKGRFMNCLTKVLK